MEIRLQKIISLAGIASRRKAEELILEARVKVNGITITELGFKADPEKSEITVNNKLISIKEEKIYIALNKPMGYISSRKDEQGRKTVIDILPIKDYIYPVGRLDYNTSGLLLLTNDGEVANTLIHPRYKIQKTYIVEINNFFSNDDIKDFERGLLLEDGLTLPAKVKILEREKQYTTLEITISEGRNRQIRRMFEFFGYNVTSLKRIRIGEIYLDNLQTGKFRYLSQNEIDWINKLLT